jgi:hypothetical protein
MGAPSARAPTWLAYAATFVACNERDTRVTGLTACKPARAVAKEFYRCFCKIVPIVGKQELYKKTDLRY